MSNPILVPLINPNEPEALLAALFVEEGQQVKEGDLICTFETTKSTADLPAELDGFVIGLQVSEGQTLSAGKMICYLAETPDWQPPKNQISDSAPTSKSDVSVPAGIRITQPALALVKNHNLDLDQFPIGTLITENTVRAFLENTTTENALLDQDFDPTSIIIFGSGGHGKACLDLLRVLDTYQVVGFIDDGRPAGEEIMGLPVLGGSELLPTLYSQGIRMAVNAVGGIGNIAVRIQVFNKLTSAGFAFPTIVHPTAFVEPSAQLAAGVQVFPHAYVGSEARVGFGSIINTGSIISHDCQLGKIVNISPGAILAGEVICGDHALVGMGATINLQVEVGAGAKIGNGATVKSNVPSKGIVRAGGIWPE